MNPLTNVRNITKLSAQDLQTSSKTSWHDEYRDSAWIFIGGLPYELSEGDVIAVFSQYGEPVNLNLIRDKGTGKSKGFGFLCYEDQRSTVLAVDNFNGIKISGRTIRVDHVKDYKPPKDSDKLDDITRSIHMQGCGPEVKNLPGLESTHQQSSDRRQLQNNDQDDIGLLPYEPLKMLKADLSSSSSKDKKRSKKEKKSKSSKKSKKSKKSSSKKSKKRKRKDSSSSSDSDSDSSSDEEDDKRRKRR